LNNAGASDGQGGAEGARKQNDPGQAQRRRLGPPVVVAVVAGVAIAAVLSLQRPAGDGAELTTVAAAQVDAAATTMDMASASAAVDDAKRCRIPLAEITLAAAPGATSTIRVRSGSYLSPSYVLTDQPQRIAIPFPAAYPSGRGVLSVEGQAQNLAVALTPVWKVNSLTGTAVMNVTWTPKTGC
jgi:hypothetical protein